MLSARDAYVRELVSSARQTSSIIIQTSQWRKQAYREYTLTQSPGPWVQNQDTSVSEALNLDTP